MNSRPAPRGNCQRSRLRGNVEVAPPVAHSKMVHERAFLCTNRPESDDWYMREPFRVPITLKVMVHERAFPCTNRCNLGRLCRESAFEVRKIPLSSTCRKEGMCKGCRVGTDHYAADRNRLLVLDAAERLTTQIVGVADGRPAFHIGLCER